MTAIRKIVFMLAKLKHDLFSKHEIPLAENITSSILQEYYIVFEEDPQKLNRLIAHFDKDGVPLNNTYIDVEEKKLHYYPISIGQYALAVFHSWLKTGDETKKTLFLKIAQWFFDSRIEDKEQGFYWLTDVPKPEHNISTPWKSAFVQSRVLSVMLRAWQLTGNHKYLDVCKKALIPFTKDIKEGGVSVRRKKRETFYEEYVAEYPTRVVDGHIFSLFGLYDFIRAVPKELDAGSHELATRLFKEGVEGLSNLWTSLDLKFWLKYSLSEVPGYPPNDPCTVGYLRLIRAQLKVLQKIAPNSQINSFLEKTIKVDKPFNIAKMYFLKYKSLKKLNRL